MSSLFDPHGYFFWLLVTSTMAFSLERLRPWRKAQRVLRRGLSQDVMGLVFNGHIAALKPQPVLDQSAPGNLQRRSLNMWHRQNAPRKARPGAIILDKDMIGNRHLVGGCPGRHHAATAKNMRNKAGRGRFAIGAGHGNNGNAGFCAFRIQHLENGASDIGRLANGGRKMHAQTR